MTLRTKRNKRLESVSVKQSTRKRRGAKGVEAWAGFVDGRVDRWSSVGYHHPVKVCRSDMPAIFIRKAGALAVYEDVRRVRITPITRKRSKED